MAERADEPLPSFRFAKCQSPFLSPGGRGCFWDEPSQSPTATALPRGRALGKEGRFRPHSLTAGRSQLLSCKLPAPAKASPFRERWHGEAVTERVDPSFGPAEHPSCSVKLRSCKKQERSTSRPRQNHNGRSTFGVSPCQRETILLKRKRTPYSTKWRRRLIIHPKMNKKIWFMFTKKRLWYDILQAMALFC